MSSCAGCGALFRCAMVDGNDGHPCWCAQLPPVALPLETAANLALARCFCPQCLQSLPRQHHPASDPERQ